MGKHAVVAVYLLAMIAIIVGVDITLFRHYLFPRLLVNIGIVFVFAAFWFRFQWSR
ncbi:hypothetical protein [Smaragdicoccus niigatensis]|uniref:hypothetical protein n=1 Tax=Smaragdicoccus niigatensis TaxID=359359 RepID=UPI0003AA0419|nr:hypothetical protein [Smaragdicoccus niigatensis]